MTYVASRDVTEASVESSATAVEWGSIFGGAFGAMGLTIILVSLGSAMGLSAVSPWSFSNPSPVTFGVAAGLWLMGTQWLASALGGYLTGRLRTKWVGIRTDETFFRDTAHGFLAWAVATLVMAALFTIGSLSAAAVGAAAGPENISAEAAEQARQAAAALSFFTALSLLMGAFIASAAGAFGGYHRDVS